MQRLDVLALRVVILCEFHLLSARLLAHVHHCAACGSQESGLTNLLGQTLRLRRMRGDPKQRCIHIFRSAVASAWRHPCNTTDAGRVSGTITPDIVHAESSACLRTPRKRASRTHPQPLTFRRDGATSVPRCSRVFTWQISSNADALVEATLESGTLSHLHAHHQANKQLRCSPASAMAAVQSARTHANALTLCPP